MCGCVYMCVCLVVGWGVFVGVCGCIYVCICVYMCLGNVKVQRTFVEHCVNVRGALT